MHELELFAWGPGLDLPSFDPFCLSAMAYLNMCGAKWTFNECHSPSVSPTGELPMLRVGAEPVAGIYNIIRTLKSKGLDLDAGLSEKELAESNAFIALIEDRLYDALLYSQWKEAVNYSKSTHPTFVKSLTYFDRFQVPVHLKSRAMLRLSKYRDVNIHDKIVPEVYLAAREAFRALANRLGNKLYFFGDRPSTLDAIAFGHLAVHAYPSLAVPKLFSLLTFEFPTLIAYASRLKEEIFVTPLVMSPNTRPSLRALVLNFIRDPASHLQYAWSGFQTRHAPDTDQIKEQRVNAFWKGVSVVGAVVFFVGYVASNGIVQIRVAEEEIEEYEEIDVDQEYEEDQEVQEMHSQDDDDDDQDDEE